MSVKTALANTFGKTVANVKSKSPEIILAASIGGIITACVTACIATTKLQPILDEHKEQLAERDAAENDKRVELSKENKDRLTTIIYVKTGLKIVKLYGPSFVLAALSIGGIMKSHSMLRKENAALIGTLTATETAFKNYRDGVIERFGKEIDDQLRCGIRQEEFEETRTDENGETKKVKQTLNVANPSRSGSPYVRYITESHPLWVLSGGNEQYILNNLLMKQSMWNDTLKIRPDKFVGINEVYSDMNFEVCSDFMVSGWEYDPADKTIDNYIEFDVREVVLPDDRGEFHRAFAIDFNAHNVYDKRRKKRKY